MGSVFQSILFGIILAFVVLLVYGTLFLTDVYAASTQQSNTIYLSPFYRQSMTNNQAYTYTVSIHPPDNIASVISAIVRFDIYISPSVNFTLQVNGQNCNNPNYYISTTYAGAGQSRITFDCSNRITTSGNYTITLKPSGQNTGAVTGWLDLTYMNNPRGEMEIKGTEYLEGDDGTLFLQLKDADGATINDGTCYISIYYPNLANQTHPYWIQDGAMMYLGNSSGVYYYDFITPAISGLYMSEATCYYTMLHNYYYKSTDPAGPNRTVIYGSYLGNSFVLNGLDEWLYTDCTSATVGGAKYCEAYYDWTVGTNITDLSVKYMGESSGSPTLTFYVWNWTSSSWYTLPNTLIFHGTATSGVPTGIDEYVSNRIPDLNNTIAANRTVRIKTTTSGGSTFHLYDNLLQLDASQTVGVLQDLKGSGELHVSSSSAESQIGRYYKVTSCGGYYDGRCAVATNDDEYDLWEGDLEENVTILAMSTRNDAILTYYTPFAVDCTALYWIKQWNGTDWNYVENYTTYSQPAYENCIVTIPIDIQSGNEYQFWLKMDNYMYWEVEFTHQIMNAIQNITTPYCESIKGNYTYTLPMPNISGLSNDTMVRFCHGLYDDFYWADLYYNDSLDAMANENAGYYASYVQEERFYRTSTFGKYNVLKLNINVTADTTGILDAIASANTSIQNKENQILGNQTLILNNQTTLFNAITSVNSTVIAANSSLSSQIANIPALVWSYYNRTLTSFNFWVNVTQEVLYNIWNHPDRNLTYYPPAVNITNATTVLNITNYTLNITNTTFDTANITDAIGSVNSTVLASNSSIFGKLYKIQDEITSVNDTTNWWGAYTNSTLWGLRAFVDGWFQTIELKLDNMNFTIGNLTANFTVDYDEIAWRTTEYILTFGTKLQATKEWWAVGWP